MCGTACLAGSQFGEVYMCIIYWTVHLVHQCIVIYILLVISELEMI